MPIKSIKIQRSGQKKNLVSKRNRNKKIKKDLSDSDDEDENIDERDLCDDDKMDDLPGTEDENICVVCSELGQDVECWYRCTGCGIWVLSLRSAANSPE